MIFYWPETAPKSGTIYYYRDGYISRIVVEDISSDLMTVISDSHVEMNDSAILDPIALTNLQKYMFSLVKVEYKK